MPCVTGFIFLILKPLKNGKNRKGKNTNKVQKYFNSKIEILCFLHPVHMRKSSYKTFVNI